MAKYRVIGHAGKNLRDECTGTGTHFEAPEADRATCTHCGKLVAVELAPEDERVWSKDRIRSMVSQKHHRSLSDEVLGYWYELGRWGISEELRNQLTVAYQTSLMDDATRDFEGILIKLAAEDAQ